MLILNTRFSFSLSIAFNGLLFFANKPNCFTTYCVTIVQQRKQHFTAKPQHSVKVVKPNRVQNSIVLYNSESNTFNKYGIAKISMRFNFNAVNREDIFFNRTCIMLINDFQRLKCTYLRHLVFAKKVVCTYRLQLLQRVAI